MNYYKQVAEMLDLEMDEKFKLKSDGIDCYGGTYYFSEDGLKCIDSTLNNNWVLASILVGKAKIVRFPFKPKIGGSYWHYYPINGAVYKDKWMGGYYDLLCWKTGNCFKTKEEALAKGRENIKAIYKEFNEA